MSGPLALISHDALAHNLQVIRHKCPQQKICAVVKSNAYGHGLVPISQLLNDLGVEGFAVANQEEATMLRKAGIRQPIIVLRGFATEAELEQLVALDCTGVLHASYQLDMLETVKLKQPLKTWFKIDSGMHRLGFYADEGVEALARAERCANIDSDLTLMTQFAYAYEYNDERVQFQYDQFMQVAKDVAYPTSLANTAMIFAYNQYIETSTWVRPGISLYGVSCFDQQLASEFDLKPVMTLTAPVIATKKLQKGDAVGYGGMWRCPHQQGKMAVIAMGYGDGYRQQMPMGTLVSVNGVACPVVGYLAMDMLTIDITHAPAIAVGDWATFWGPEQPVEKLAWSVGASPYEMLTHIGQRVHRQPL